MRIEVVERPACDLATRRRMTVIKAHLIEDFGNFEQVFVHHGNSEHDRRIELGRQLARANLTNRLNGGRAVNWSDLDARKS